MLSDLLTLLDSLRSTVPGSPLQIVCHYMPFVFGIGVCVNKIAYSYVYVALGEFRPRLLFHRTSTHVANKKQPTKFYYSPVIFLQRSLSLTDPPSPKPSTNISPAAAANLTPIDNSIFVPPMSGLPSTSGGAPNATISAAPRNTSDVALQ